MKTPFIAVSLEEMVSVPRRGAGSTQVLRFRAKVAGHRATHAPLTLELYVIASRHGRSRGAQMASLRSDRHGLRPKRTFRMPEKGLAELKCWLDIHFHNGREAGERGGLKLLGFGPPTSLTMPKTPRHFAGLEASSSVPSGSLRSAVTN